MEKAFKLHVDTQGIAELIFDKPDKSMNVFSADVMDELGRHLEDLAYAQDIKVLLIKSAKKNCFIAGADINEIEEVKSRVRIEQMITMGHDVFSRLEKLPYPTIAVIDGVCLGGGLELALACTYRVVTDHAKTSLGLPEVSLGIIPGWGGTQRLPRLIGLTQGMQMILSGKAIDARKAYKLKLADAIFPKEFLADSLLDFAKKCQIYKEQDKIIKRRKQKGLISFFLEKTPFGRSMVFKNAKKSVLAKSGGHYPAPLAALKVLQRSFHIDIYDGLKIEIEEVVKLVDNPITKHLISLFHTGEELKKDPGLLNAHDRSKAIRSTAVLGAGIMGGGIAWLLSKKEYPVRIKDISWNGIAQAYQSAQGIYNQLLKIRKIKPHEVNRKMHCLSGTVDYSGFKQLDIIIEAIVEDLTIKKQIFNELEQHIRSDAILCSNTSSLSIKEISENMVNPERFVGMHFFNPVNRMPLVEVIPSDKTDPDVIVTVVSLLKQLGKTPIIVGDCPGFLVNRILLAGMTEALHLLKEGVDMEFIDSVIEAYGMPMGPFLLADTVGIDVAYKVILLLEKAYGDRMHAPDFLREMVDLDLLGKKNKAGFYLYQGKTKQRNSRSSIDVISKKGTSKSSEEVLDRFIFSMLNEACRCLEENIIRKPHYLDMALILGTGYPPFRGGLLKEADSLGIDVIIKKCEHYSQSVHSRFTPCELLYKMQRGKHTFYQSKGDIPWQVAIN